MNNEIKSRNPFLCLKEGTRNFLRSLHRINTIGEWPMMSNRRNGDDVADRLRIAAMEEGQKDQSEFPSEY